jgi:hypothetical protein
MVPNCIHGIDEKYCARCRKAFATKPIEPDAIVITSKNKPALILGESSLDGRTRVLLLENSNYGYITELNIHKAHHLSQNSDRYKKALVGLLKVSRTNGYIFFPEYPLTSREQGPEGPSRCYNCHLLLSLKLHSLGCTQCRYYVCKCGRCLCGYGGVNYLHQRFEQNPELPISWEDRCDYVRVINFCMKMANVDAL